MLVTPRATMGALDTSDAGSGIVGDAVIFLVLRFVATQLPLLVVTIWASASEHGRFALFQLLAIFQDAVVNDLVIILVASVVISIAAGRRRRADRDVELGVACWVPYTAVETLGWLLQVVLGITLGDRVRLAMWGVALAFCLGYVILAIGVARLRELEEARPA